MCGKNVAFHTSLKVVSAPSCLWLWEARLELGFHKHNLCSLVSVSRGIIWWYVLDHDQSLCTITVDYMWVWVSVIGGELSSSWIFENWVGEKGRGFGGREGGKAEEREGQGPLTSESVRGGERVREEGRQKRERGRDLWQVSQWEGERGREGRENRRERGTRRGPLTSNKWPALISIWGLTGTWALRQERRETPSKHTHRDYHYRQNTHHMMRPNYNTHYSRHNSISCYGYWKCGCLTGDLL